MGPSALRTPRLFGSLVAVVVSLVALVPPLGYFSLGYSAIASALQTETEVKAEIIGQAINASPEMWRFEEHRLRDMLVRFPIELDDEQARVLGSDGEVIAASPNAVESLAMTRSTALFDAGVEVGRVEVRRSLRGLLIGSGWAAAVGAALSSALVALLRILRARGRRVAEAMFDEQERARVTLHCIADAVITTDADELIEYLNPVAESLTQWTLAEARGRPVHQVCRLIDESTMDEAPVPTRQALRDDRVCRFSGKDIALVRRDGSTVAIEDSAAPIHDRHGRIIGGAMVFHDVSATRRMAQRIGWAATHDSLTGLVNRREFETRVEAALLSARNSARHHVLCYLDLDQFKVVNDTCGHAAGDGLLKQLATLLQTRLREADTLARLGGDEFGVLLEGCPLDRAQVIATDLLAAIRDCHYAFGGRTFGVSASIGLVAINAHTADRAEVFSAADTACYSAKEQGRNRVCTFLDSDADMARRRHEMGWAARLNNAMEDDRLTLYYQPYLPLAPGGSPGVHIEVLLRLIDEDGTLVQPGSFLPAAERYNIMPAIDRWVIRTVFSRYDDLARQLGAPLTCAINLSGTSLNAEGLLEFIREQSALHKLPAGAVCFEITETAAINDLRHAAQFMADVKGLGFQFALDDFGIGTSSFGYLKMLPVDYLKIDGSFVRNMVNDPIDRAMAETINRIGHIMGLKTVGEFAASDAAIDELRVLGVDFAQGYAVQRPQPLPAPLQVQRETAACLRAASRIDTPQA